MKNKQNYIHELAASEGSTHLLAGVLCYSDLGLFSMTVKLDWDIDILKTDVSLQ